MRTKITCLLLFLILSGPASTGQGFHKGDKDVTLSIGYGTPWVFKADYKSRLIPIGLAFDYGATEQLGPGVLSLGAFLTATTYAQEVDNILWQYEYGRKATFIGLALRSTYHVRIIEQLDTYVFLHLGAGYEEWKSFGTLPPLIQLDLDPRVRFMIGAGVGAKYYFTETVAALAEVGYGTAYFKLGLGIRL